MKIINAKEIDQDASSAMPAHLRAAYRLGQLWGCIHDLQMYVEPAVNVTVPLKFFNTVPHRPLVTYTNILPKAMALLGKIRRRGHIELHDEYSDRIWSLILKIVYITQDIGDAGMSANPSMCFALGFGAGCSARAKAHGYF